jgi:hypothetical protein
MSSAPFVPAAAAPPPQRHGDRGDEDDSPLPVYCRYRDLVRAGICTNWPQLSRMIAEGFPPGILLSANIRAWEVEAVKCWLAMRPTERKPAPKRRDAKTINQSVESSL